MWFHRVIAWVRSLFSAAALDDTAEGPESHRASFGAYQPTMEPEFTRRQLLYPRDPLKAFGLGAPQDDLSLDDPLYDPPKTVPLMRLSPQVELRFDEPTQPLHVVGEPPTAMSSREPTQPAPSEPLSASLQRLRELPDTPETYEHMDDLDDTTRRLIFLRRLVRQRVYNEGFALDETPEQYRHSHGLSEQRSETDSQN